MKPVQNMDIEKLKKKRQLNVQEQNAIAKHRIYTEAYYWRENGTSIILKDALKSKGVNPNNSIYLDYE